MRNDPNRVEPRMLAVMLLASCVAACETAADADDVREVRPMLTGLSTEASEIAWGPCEDEELQMLGAVCGMLDVPLDHSRPDCEQIQLAVSKLEHTVPDEEYLGAIVANPGGPGGQGLLIPLDFAEYLRPDVLAAYDWIGFDPRGVGSSVPKLNCEDSAVAPLPPLTPSTPELEKFWLERTEAYANACQERGGELLNHMRTTDVALDLDRIRAAIHSPKLNFYGYSYGTYLGQVYATMFPERVGRMVLDSNIRPSGDWYAFMLEYPIGTNNTLVAWRAWIAQHNDYFQLGATQAEVEKAFDATSAALLEAPAGGVVGPTEWGALFLGVAYSQDAWPYFGELWKNWLADGDPAPLVAEYESGGSDDNSHAVFSAVTCTDMIWPKSWSKWREDTWAIYAQAPRAWGMTWYSAPCLFWKAQGQPAVEVVGEGVAPILLLGETEDGVTGFSNSLEVRRRFPSSSLVGTAGGTNHGYSPTGNPCVDDRIADYLLRGTLPARVEGEGADVLCDPLPLPEPGPPPVAQYVYGERSASAGQALRLARSMRR